jgi:protein O-mannosyl-transferase
MTLRLSAIPRVLRAPLILLGVVAATYANSLGNGFQFDDEHSLVANPAVRQLSRIPAFFVDPELFSRNPGSAMYRPLVLTSYALNYAMGEYRVAGYHVLNIAIHALVVLTVYLLLVDISGRRKAALAASLFVAVHPLAAEPVNYISSRSESMAALGYVAALLLYRRRVNNVSWASVLAFGAGLLCKSTAITLPALLLLHDHALTPQGLRRVWQRHWPYWALALTYVIGTRSLLSEATIAAPVRPLFQHLLTQITALVYYARQLAWPQPLSVEHQFAVADGLGEPTVLLALLLAGSWAWLLRSNAGAKFWCGWMLIALLPTLVVPLNVLVNQRRLYMPLIAMAGLLVCLLPGRLRPGRLLAAVAAALAVLAVLTIQHNRVWRDAGSLWTHARQVAPLAPRPYLRLGSVYRQAGVLDQAEGAYLRALELDPLSAAAYNNLGNLYESRGELEAAEQAYGSALGLAPRYPEALTNLGTLHSRSGRLDLALVLLDSALRIGGEREELLNSLGTTQLRAGNYLQAELALRRAARLNPRRAGIHYNLGGALEGQGQLVAAVAAYRHALDLDSTFARGAYKLGELYQRLGRREDALAAFESFLRHWSGDPRLAAQARQRLDALQGAD